MGQKKNNFRIFFTVFPVFFLIIAIIVSRFSLSQKQTIRNKAEERSPSSALQHSNPFGICCTRPPQMLAIDNSLQQLIDFQNVGVRWVRLSYNWFDFQPKFNDKTHKPVPIDWSDKNVQIYDNLVKGYTSKGIKVLGLIGGIPNWARRDSCIDPADPSKATVWCPPKNNNDYASFSGELAKHYSALGVHNWEVWNEPNTQNFWKTGVNAAEYTELLKVTYTQIKNSDPTAKVVSAGLVPRNTTGGRGPVEFLQQMYANGAKNYFDALGYHPYCTNHKPDCIDNDPASGWKSLLLTRAVMVANGDSAKEVWLTEFGTPTRGDNTMTEAEQAKLLEAAYAKQKSLSWTGPLFWYEYQEEYHCNSSPPPPIDRRGFFGITRCGGSRKPAYAAFKALAHPESPDAIAPTINITSPSNNATISGNISVKVSASDNRAITKITLAVDGVMIAEKAVASYEFSLTTSALRNTVHSIGATAYDAAGNQGSANIKFIVNNSARPKWSPALTNMAGVYSAPLTVEDVDKLHAMGVNVTFTPGKRRGAEEYQNMITAMTNYGMHYIDRGILNLILKDCSGVCPDEETLLSDVQKYIDSVNNDPLLIGFYIKDDSGAPMSTAIKIYQKIDKANNIALANPSVGFARPTLCGFSGNIRTGVVNSLPAYSPLACNIVMPYMYTKAIDTATYVVDWGLTQGQITKLKDYIIAHGGKPENIIGIPQVFHYQNQDDPPGSSGRTPTADQVAAQIQAYCRDGALGIFPYAYHNYDLVVKGVPKQENLQPELGTPGSKGDDLRAGYKKGIKACGYWKDLTPTPTVPLPSPTPISTRERWPFFYHKYGAYDVSLNGPSEEIPLAASLGMTFGTTRYHDPDHKSKLNLSFFKNLHESNFRYIDPYFLGTITKYMRPCPVGSIACTMTASNEAKLKIEVKAHLDKVANDPNIIGFYMLDDFQGNTLKQLIEIHTMIAEANKTSIFSRPTLCAFGISLDWKATPSAEFTPIDGPSRPYFNKALLNYSPQACDLIILYHYGRNHYNDSSSVDWSMKNLLPYALNAFKQKGWDPSTQPLIGTPQTFSYGWNPASTGVHFLTPTKQNITDQITAFCTAGASAIVPYAFNDSKTTPKSELYNSADMQEGFKQGVLACDKIWGVSLIPTPTPEDCDSNHGDANCDGKIDLIDFNLWRQQFTTATVGSADFNSDGKVDLVDFNIWRTDAQL